MSSKIIVLGIVVLILILIIYLAVDSGIFRRIRKVDTQKGKAMLASAVPASSGGSIKNGPTINIRCPGECRYTAFKMNKKKICIGSNSKCDIVCDDELVEDVHAVIEVKNKNGKVFFEIINVSKFNPIDYLVQDEDEKYFESLGYKRGVILSGTDVVYVGETKLVIQCVERKHVISKTDQYILNKKEITPLKQSLPSKKGEEVSIDEMEDRFVSKDEDVSHMTKTPIHKKNPSIRVVSKNEIDL